MSPQNYLKTERQKYFKLRNFWGAINCIIIGIKQFTQGLTYVLRLLGQGWRRAPPPYDTYPHYLAPSSYSIISNGWSVFNQVYVMIPTFLDMTTHTTTPNKKTLSELFKYHKTFYKQRPTLVNALGH